MSAQTRSTVLGLLLVLGSCTVVPHGQKRDRRDGSDPDPTVPLFPKGENKNANANSSKRRPAPPILNETFVSRELTGFGIGQPIHRRYLEFSNRVSNEIRNMVAAGHPIERIV